MNSNFVMEVQKESLISELTARLSQFQERVMPRIGELTARIANLNRYVKIIKVRVQSVENEYNMMSTCLVCKSTNVRTL